MVITLNFLLGGLFNLCSTEFILWSFTLFLHWEHILLSPHFAVFISIHLVSGLHFPTSEKQPLVGEGLCVSAAHSHLVTRATYPRVSPHVGCVSSFNYLPVLGLCTLGYVSLLYCICISSTCFVMICFLYLKL